MNFRTCLFPVFVGVLSACSSAATAPANKAPIVDDVQGPATATVGATGTYQLQLKITCHDDDGLITQASIEIPGFAANVIQTPKQMSFKDIPVSLQLDGRAPKGLLTYTVVVIDDQGAKGSKTATVTLE
jgi:hypothetical protein